MTDRIVYLVVTEGGGVDGRDSSVKPQTKFASFSREEAMKHLDAWSKLQVKVIEDCEGTTQKLLKNLNAIDRLLLEEYFA